MPSIKSMRRVAAIIAVFVLFGALDGVVNGETIYLKSGSKIVGKILEQDDDRVRIEVEVDGGGKAVIGIDRKRIDRIETATTRAERIAAAEDLLDIEEFDRAESDFRDLVRNEPKDARARLGLAKALVGLYRYDEAVKTLEHYLVLVKQDRDAGLMMYLAGQYLEAHEYRDAKKTAREAAALYPDDAELQVAADEFSKRVDRVRSGAEQLKERETAHTAMIKQRIEERAEWDKERGNSHESVKVGQELADWAAESWPKLVLGRYLDIDANKDEWRDYARGADVERLRGKVTRCQLKFTVDEVRWRELYDHQKAVVLYGWYYQLKSLYPRSNPVVTVVTIKEERGKEKEVNLARASWDGRREQVIVDRWTQENRDPDRPRPAVNK